MAKFTLSNSDRERISTAVTAAEARSNGEIVTVIAERSDAYHDVGLHYAMAAVFLLLGAVAAFPQESSNFAEHWLGGWDHMLSPRQLMTIFTCMAIILFLAVRYLLAWMPLRILLTPSATRQRRVRRAAISVFRTAVEGRTRGRTGILLYLSLIEHQAEIVADAAITAKVDPEAWGEAMASLIHHVRQGRSGDGMIEAISQIGAILAQHMPRCADDRDELPDRLIEL